MSTHEFNSLIVGSYESLTPFAVTLTRDQESAKDLCQETVCKALVYKEYYQAGTNVKAWLLTIMRNIFINQYRRGNRKKLMMDTVRYSTPQFSASSDGTVRYKEINTAVYHLPDHSKKACILYLEGYRYQEIAEAMNEPLGTIKSRIHFARKLLQKNIDR